MNSRNHSCIKRRVKERKLSLVREHPVGRECLFDLLIQKVLLVSVFRIRI